MGGIDGPESVAREYATLERVAMRRLDRTGWLRFGGDDAVFHLLRALAEVRPERVLDVGCGDGWLTSMIAAPEVVCLDQSQAAVEAARGRGLDARVGDVQELPFPDESFDAVVCSYVLYQVRDRPRALGELARVLRPGGRFAGVYNFPDHLSELWEAVGRSEEVGFDCESGVAQLESYFERVECRAARGAVHWLDRADLQAYLDAYSELIGALEAPEGPYPFVARRRNGVLLGEKR